MALIDAYNEAMYHDLEEEDINEQIAKNGYSFGY